MSIVSVDRIKCRKIDAEGADLEVLRGARAMLAAHRIDLVEVEAGMNPRNDRHAQLEPLKTYLEDMGTCCSEFTGRLTKGPPTARN